jgi:hypothetical protein
MKDRSPLSDQASIREVSDQSGTLVPLARSIYAAGSVHDTARKIHCRFILYRLRLCLITRLRLDFKLVFPDI